jgi:hypothetical protein
MVSVAHLPSSSRTDCNQCAQSSFSIPGRAPASMRAKQAMKLPSIAAKISTAPWSAQGRRAQHTSCRRSASQHMAQLASVMKGCTSIGILEVHVSPRRKQCGDHGKVLLLRIPCGTLQRALRSARAVEVSKGMDFQLAWCGRCACRIPLPA